jgi:hypothetical protein
VQRVAGMDVSVPMLMRPPVCRTALYILEYSLLTLQQGTAMLRASYPLDDSCLPLVLYILLAQGCGPLPLLHTVMSAQATN